jgi:hypothetical protein
VNTNYEASNADILHTTLLSNIINLYSSLELRYQVSQLYKITGQITALHILIFTVYDKRGEGRMFWTKRTAAHTKLRQTISVARA